MWLPIKNIMKKKKKIAVAKFEKPSFMQFSIQ